MKNKNVRLLMIFNFLNDFRLYSAFLIIYLSSITKSIATGMGLLSITMIVSAISEIPTGIISDLIGRKKTIIMGAIFSTLAVFFYAIGNNIFLLLFASILLGMSQALFSGNNEALLYDSLKENDSEVLYKEYLGKTSSMFQLGLAISAILGGIVSIWSIKLVFYFSIIPQLLSLFVVLLIKPVNENLKDQNPYKHFKASIKEFFKNKDIRQISLLSACDYSLLESSYEMSAIFIKLVWPTWSIGIYKFLTNIFGAVGFWFSGKVIKKMSHKKALISSNLISCVLNLIGFVFKGVLSPIFISLSSLMFGINITANGDIKQSYFSGKYRATLGSIDSLIKTLFFSIFAVIFGLIADKIGVGYSFITIQSILVIITFIYPIVLKDYKKNYIK